MTGPGPTPDAAELLRAQLADLARFRHVVEAQRAVLRMEDAQLLGAYSREASAIADAVLTRDSTLLSLRLAAQASRREWDRGLDAEVRRISAQASAESRALAQQMEVAAQDIARELEGVGQRLDQVVGQRYGREVPGRPVVVDRTG